MLYHKIIIIALTILGVLSAQAIKIKDFKIKYLSASHVYLQGGEKDGLEAGDELIVFRENEKIGRIKIEFVSRPGTMAGATDY